ncbi:hypothetical protein [Thermosediminibacter litoriperuensis]|uniref:Uncharacterized protein n=1 Tax=Thermosediminibacter litoriperuensis TaxID=291989 RepID=A0A5S5AEB4_9FIRM|nr:hypothetical protein [Thermosediminibacter litoriperuensis]TYP48171.1 hypothetical protein LZ11_02340 [Thermosediminibacter litoriperuensis]
MAENYSLNYEDVMAFFEKLINSENVNLYQRDMAEIYAGLVKDLIWVDISRK